MAEIEIVSQNPLTLAEVKSRLSKLAKEGEEPSTRVSRVMQYIDDFTEMKDKEVQELKKKFEELGIQRLKDKIIVKIIDVQPKSVDDLKILFIGENVTLKADDLNRIIEVINGK
jgi:DNA-directed RNA polymerase subunit F